MYFWLQERIAAVKEGRTVAPSARVVVGEWKTMRSHIPFEIGRN
jgi:hypothetical protein